MTPLRQKMIDVMTVRNLSPRTQTSYLYALRSLVKYYHRSPDLLNQQDLQDYLLYLIRDRHLAPASCRLQLNGIRFFFRHILGWSDIALTLHYPKRPQRIPELLTRNEVKSLLSACRTFKHHVLLSTCYGLGLRVSELVAIQVSQIDGQRHLLHVVQGKGGKDRLVPIPGTLLTLLRLYWQRYRPSDAFFYNEETGRPLGTRGAMKAFHQAKDRAGIHKQGGIHSLRHAFATHLLEQGLPIHLLQRWLGHNHIQTTMRYIHWIPDYHLGKETQFDLLA